MNDSRFLLGNNASQKTVEQHFQSREREKINSLPRIPYLVRISFKNQDKNSFLTQIYDTRNLSILSVSKCTGKVCS